MKTKPLLLMIVMATLLANTEVWAGPGAHGPNGEHLEAPANAVGPGMARLPDGSVNLPKLAQRRMEIRTLPGKLAEHPMTLELNGRVMIDPNAGGRVQAPFAGRIEPGPKGLPVVGQQVKKGEVLLAVRPVAGAIERANQQGQLADIRANRGLVEQRLKRLESLEGVVPNKEVEAARAELSSLRGRERAVSGSVSGSESVTASATGVIATSGVLAGQIVEARDVLFEIVDPARMVIEAYSTDVNLAARIQSASLAGIDDVELRFLGGGRSLKEGALPLSFRASTRANALAVGQPVTVIVKLSDKVKGIALPAAAVVRNPANEAIVWIKAGAERFLAQPVQLKPLDEKTVVVVKGLAADNRVVVSGAALINQIR
jgi:cobalt-zinc-cadmium efflux system membrane fusion protein